MSQQYPPVTRELVDWLLEQFGPQLEEADTEQEWQDAKARLQVVRLLEAIHNHHQWDLQKGSSPSSSEQPQLPEGLSRLLKTNQSSSSPTRFARPIPLRKMRRRRERSGG